MWYIQSAAAFLRVSCELTTIHHSVCGRMTQRWREIVEEGSVDVKHNRYDYTQMCACMWMSAQLLMDRRVRATHLVLTLLKQIWRS